MAPDNAPRLNRGAALRSAAEAYAAAQTGGTVIQRSFKGDNNPDSPGNRELWDKIVAKRHPKSGPEVKPGRLAREREVFEDLVRSRKNYSDLTELLNMIDALIQTGGGQSSDDGHSTDEDGADGDQWDDQDYWDDDEEGYSDDYDDELVAGDALEAAGNAARERLIASVRRKVAQTPLCATIIWTGGNMYKEQLELAREIAPELWDDQNKIIEFIRTSTGSKLQRFRANPRSAMLFASSIQQQHDQEREFKDTVQLAEAQLRAITDAVAVYAPREVFLTAVDIPQGWHRFDDLAQIGAIRPPPGHRQILMTMGHGSQAGETFLPTEKQYEDNKSFMGLNSVLGLPADKSVLYVPVQCFPNAAVQKGREAGVHAASVQSSETIGNAQLLEWLDLDFLREIDTWLPEAASAGGGDGSASSATSSSAAAAPTGGEEAAATADRQDAQQPPPLPPGKVADKAADAADNGGDSAQLKARPAPVSRAPVMQLMQIDDLAKLDIFGLNVASWAEFDERLSKVTSRHGLAMRMAALSGQDLSLTEHHALALMRAQSDRLFGHKPDLIDHLTRPLVPPPPKPDKAKEPERRQVRIKSGPHFTQVHSTSELLVWLISNPLLSRIGLKGWAEPDVLGRVLLRLETDGRVLDASYVWNIVAAELGSVSSDSDDEIASDDRVGDRGDDGDDREPWPHGYWSKTKAFSNEQEIGGPDRGDETFPVAAEFRREMDPDQRKSRIAALEASLSGYTLVGVHATTAENIGGLVKFGPQAAKTGSGNQLGKGRGFYVIPVGAVSLEKALASAKGWGSHIVAVYIKGELVSKPGGSRRVEENVVRDRERGYCYVYASLELVIPEYMYPRIRIVRDPDDITMASPGYKSAPTERNPLEFLM